MSDEREQDAATLIAQRREWYDQATAYMAAQGMPAIAWGIQWKKDLEETGAYLRTIDRLTAERDQALYRIEQLYASTVSQGVHDKMVDLYNRAIDERDQAREQLAKLEEVCEEYFDVKDALAERSRYGIDSAWYGSMSDAVGKAENAIRAALGIESEAGE